MPYQWGCWQMKSGVKYIGIVCAGALLSSCTYSNNRVTSASDRTAPADSSVSDDIVKIGNPYNVAGRTYTPVDITDYDEVGYASWYGEEMDGSVTANGETFVPAGISAAHKTLPLPSYVEVTRLDTGRTILVRVNDRGPFSNDRLIDLSAGAARQLGIDTIGAATVRVRRVNPPAQVRAQLRSGREATVRNETSESLLKILRERAAQLPKPAASVQSSAPLASPPVAKVRPDAGLVQPVAMARSGKFIIESDDMTRSAANTYVSNPRTSPATGTAGYYVQVAAFSSRARADKLAARIDAKVFHSADRNVYRVRYGPYNTDSAAKQGIDKARQNGFASPRILRGE